MLFPLQKSNKIKNSINIFHVEYICMLLLSIIKCTQVKIYKVNLGV